MPSLQLTLQLTTQSYSNNFSKLVQLEIPKDSQ